VDREEFRNLLLLLRPELRDRDIPHRGTMHTRIIQTYDEALRDLSEQIQVFYIFSYMIIS
jgi:hypothetical protein